jgi:hypothetical protein
MTSDEIQQCLERSFAIDCPRMVLRQNVESDTRVYEGPGSIYQNNEGELLFKLYSTNRSHWDSMRNTNSARRRFGKPPEMGAVLMMVSNIV